VILWYIVLSCRQNERTRFSFNAFGIFFKDLFNVIWNVKVGISALRRAKNPFGTCMSSIYFLRTALLIHVQPCWSMFSFVDPCLALLIHAQLCWSMFIEWNEWWWVYYIFKDSGWLVWAPERCVPGQPEHTGRVPFLSCIWIISMNPYFRFWCGRYTLVHHGWWRLWSSLIKIVCSFGEESKYLFWGVKQHPPPLPLYTPLMSTDVDVVNTPSFGIRYEACGQVSLKSCVWFKQKWLKCLWTDSLTHSLTISPD